MTLANPSNGRPGTRSRRSSASPEHTLQKAVKRFLLVALPPQVEWTSSLAGAHLSPTQRAKAKAGGLRPGWYDLQFLIEGPTPKAPWETRFIELKAEKGRLSDDQIRIGRKLGPHGAVCRSVEEVEAALRAWGVRLRASVSNRAEACPTGNGGAAVVAPPGASAHLQHSESRHKETTT